MDRKEIILQMCSLEGKGLEIGPSYNPVAPKKDGYDVEILDHLDKDGLIKKYQNSSVNIENIEEVDYIWNGEKYSVLTGRKSYYDYIIASNIIEHTYDLIGFLNDCSEMLVDNGVLILIIPDKKFCFDALRPATGFAKVIDSHICESNIHTAGSIIEHLLNACKNNDKIAWDSSIETNKLHLVHKIADVKDRVNNHHDSSNFDDIHNWVFTKSSFELLIYDLSVLDLIDLEIDNSYDTVGSEFFASLKKTTESVVPDEDLRLQLALRMNSEETLSMRELTQQYDELVQQYSELARHNNNLNIQIQSIYNSNTWKIGKKLNRIYRSIIPRRV